MYTYSKPTKSFWAIAVIAILWNLGGTFQFLSATVLKDILYKTLTEPQITLFENLPSWYLVFFAIAVISGLFGSMFLILRKKLAITLFAISLVAVVVQMIYWIFATDVIEVYGTADAVSMPIIVIVTSLVLFFYSKTAARNGWIS